MPVRPSIPLLRTVRLLLPLAAGLLVWKILPGGALDRWWFETTVRGFINPPWFLDGQGSREDPWSLRAASPRLSASRAPAPPTVSLGDDEDGIFQSSPPGPVDMSLILRNLHRLGADTAALATILAWPEPDMISLTALEISMQPFERILTTAPLSRGAVPAPLPPAFRRASLPFPKDNPAAATLPAINRSAIPDAILGGENALAGFCWLETEPEDLPQPLLARWQDRVVLSFPVLVALERFKLPVEGVRWLPGRALLLSEHGPVVPLDEHGRLPIPPPGIDPPSFIPVAELIDGEDGLLPADTPSPWLLVDQQSAADPALRRFGEQLPAWLDAIQREAGLAPARRFARPGPILEISLLTLLAGLALLARFAPPLGCRVLWSVLAALAWGAQWAAAAAGGWVSCAPAWACLAATAWLLPARAQWQGRLPALPRLPLRAWAAALRRKRPRRSPQPAVPPDPPENSPKTVPLAPPVSAESSANPPQASLTKPAGNPPKRPATKKNRSGRPAKRKKSH